MTLSIKDPGSAITHFIGMILAAAASTPLLLTAVWQGDLHSVPALAVFALSMILLYGASTIYHTLNISEKVNKILRKIDHMMIFILIVMALPGSLIDSVIIIPPYFTSYWTSAVQ